MENEYPQVEIPELSGKKDGRRKGGAGAWGGSGGAGGVSGAGSGFGRAGMAAARVGAGHGLLGSGSGVFGSLGGFLSGGMGNALLAAAVGATSLYSMHSLNAGAPNAGALRPGQVFSRPAYSESATRGLPTDSGGGADSLQYLNSANRGGLDQPQAAPANAGTQASNAGDQNAAPAANDAAAAASAQAAAAGGGQGPFASRFGQLSSGHGALNGGAGLSGGIGKGFDSPAFNPKGTNMGQLTAMASAGKASTYNASAPRRAVVSMGSNRNLNRLKSMSAAMRPTTGMANLQGASAIHTEQWSAAQPVSGGAGLPATGAGAGTAIAGGPPDAGGPVQAADKTAGNPTAAPLPTSPSNVTPWAGLVNIAQMLIMAAAAIIFTIGALTLYRKIVMGSPAGAVVAASIWSLQGALLLTALGLAGAAAAIGVYVMAAMGQTAQGLMLTISGGILATLAYMALFADGVSPLTAVLSGAGAIGSSLMGMMSKPKGGQ